MKALILALAVFSAHTCLAGGVDGGGGGLIPQFPSNTGNTKFAVENLRQYMLPVFAQLELLATVTKGSKDPYFQVIGRLFDTSSGSDIYQEFNSLKFVVYPDCLDKNGDAQDAVAFPPKSDEICFDADRMAPKLEVAEEWAPLIALAIHELSHHLGYSENEAVMLQRMVNQSLSVRHIYNMKDSFDDLNRKIEDIEFEAKGIEAHINSGFQPDALCVRLGMFRQQAVEVQNFISNVGNMRGYMPLTLQGWVNTIALQMKALSMTMYCMAPPERSSWDTIFAGKPSDTLNAVMTKLSSGKSQFDFGNRMIYDIGYRDKTTALTEISEIESLVAEIKGQIFK
jgi:hypothetical protein